MKDGHLNKCIDCTKNDVALHKTNNLEAVREYDRRRGSYPERIRKSMLYTRKYRLENRIKYKAHTAVKIAIKNGTLIKPNKCENKNCKEIIIHQMEAHHDDYSKPLDVIWLCSVCHKRKHLDTRINPDSLELARLFAERISEVIRKNKVSN